MLVFARGTDSENLDLSDVNDSFRLESHAESPLIFAHVCIGKSLEWTAGTLVELPSKTAGCLLSEEETQNGRSVVLGPYGDTRRVPMKKAMKKTNGGG